MFDRLVIVLSSLSVWLSFAWLLYETDYMRVRLYMGANPYDFLNSLNTDDEIEVNDFDYVPFSNEYEELCGELYQAQCTLDAAQQVYATNRASELIKIIGRSGANRGRIENLTLRQFHDINGYEPYKSCRTKDGKHTPWEYSLDGKATEMGYGSDVELRDAILEAKVQRDKISALKAEIGSLERALRSY